MAALPKVTDAEKDLVRARVPLSSLIAPKVKLTRKGAEWVGLCPFHSEKSPSFTVRDDKGFFHCFGCGAHGEHYAWVMRYYGLDFPAAAAKLRGEAGLAEPQPEGKRDPALDRESEAARQRREAAEAEAARAKQWLLDRALEDWAHARADTRGTPSQAYLAARQILPGRQVLGSWPWSLRHMGQVLRQEEGPGGTKRRTWHPALLAAIQRHDPANPQARPDGRGDPIVGIHATYLRDDGADRLRDDGKGKAVRGWQAGGAIRLTPARRRMVLAEGLETALAVARLLRIRVGVDDPSPDAWGLWVAINFGNLVGPGAPDGARAPHPAPRPGGPTVLPTPEPDMSRPAVILPPVVRHVLQIADNDAKDSLEAAEKIRRGENRRRREGRTVASYWPRPGADAWDEMIAALGEGV